MELGFHDLALLHCEGEARRVRFDILRHGDALVDLLAELVAHHSEIDRVAVAAEVPHKVVVVAVHALGGLEIDVLYAARHLVDVELDVVRRSLVREVALGAVGELAVEVEVHLVLPLDRDAQRAGVGRASALLGHEPLGHGAVFAGGVAGGRAAVGEVDTGLALELLLELLEGLVLGVELLHLVLSGRADAPPVLAQPVDLFVVRHDDLEAVELVAVRSGVREGEVDVQ